MFSLLGFGIYFLLWWMAFFIVLPIGARSAAESNAEVAPGSERGAPLQHNLGKKALWAAGLAGLMWIGVYVAIALDVFAIRR
jgi:predicted secreted protein